MAKTNSSFKLSKSAKWMLANVVDKHRRAELKRVLIDGEITRETTARTRGRPRQESASE